MTGYVHIDRQGEFHVVPYTGMRTVTNILKDHHMEVQDDMRSYPRFFAFFVEEEEDPNDYDSAVALQLCDALGMDIDSRQVVIARCLYYASKDGERKPVCSQFNEEEIAFLRRMHGQVRANVMQAKAEHEAEQRGEEPPEDKTGNVDSVDAFDWRDPTRKSKKRKRKGNAGKKAKEARTTELL